MEPSTPEQKTAREGPFLVHLSEAGDGTRTHDPQLGKLMLYQLSYTRVPHILALQDFTSVGVLSLPALTAGQR